MWSRGLGGQLFVGMACGAKGDFLRIDVLGGRGMNAGPVLPAGFEGGGGKG